MSKQKTTEIVPAGNPAGFQSNPTTEIAKSSADHAAIAREQHEIQGKMTLAKQFPRDESNAYTDLMAACRRPRFSEGAVYRFPRGGSSIEGPSVKLAREAARCWGNIYSGSKIVSSDEERTLLESFAIDLQSNTSKSTQISFKNLVQRKGKGWVKPDERDYRELVNKNAAILERNAILQLIPPDVVDDAMEEAKKTNTKAAKGEVGQDRDASIRRIVLAFGGHGVKKEHIEKFLGYELDGIAPEDLTKLRDIYSSIADGNSKASEVFDMKKSVGSGRAEIAADGSVASNVKSKKPKEAKHAEKVDSPQPQE